MSVTYGFYNSNNGDRKYNARQISSIFDGIINDGIYLNYANHFDVTDARVVNGSNGMYVYVNTGRAWLNHTWTLNDAILKLDIDAADLSRPRIDTVVIEVNESTRINSIKIVKGTPANDPTVPTLTNTSTIHQYPLADIRVNAGVTYIALSDIYNRIGKDAPAGTPWVTGLFETMSIDSIIAQWQEQWRKQTDKWDKEASERLETFMKQYTANADAALLELLSEALGNNRILRVFGTLNLLKDEAFPTTAGSEKTYSNDSLIVHSNDELHDFTKHFFPSTNIQVGDYLIDQNGYIAELTYKTGIVDDTKIYSFTVKGTGISIAPQVITEKPKVLYYIPGGSRAELPASSESKVLDSQAMTGVYPPASVVKDDVLISPDGKVARVVEAHEWDEQIRDYLTTVVGLDGIESRSSVDSVYTSLELNTSSELIVRLHNVSSAEGLYIKVQKLTGRNKGSHRWMDDPIGFADLTSRYDKYLNVPIPSWMPNEGVLQTRFVLTNDALSTGLIINPSTWILDAMKPIFVFDGTPTDDADTLAGFADGSYVALVGQYLSYIESGRHANTVRGKKYTLDVRYRFVLCRSDGTIVGTTHDALSIPYRTFWSDYSQTCRAIQFTSAKAYLGGSFRIVPT